MVRDSSIVSRGQVFYYNPIWGIFGGKDKVPHMITYTSNGSLEFKTRPYLVVSTDKGNFSSTTCNLVPLTTRDSTAIPSQVKFRANHRDQVALTEQILTANISDLGNYCFTVSEEVMKRIERGLMIQLDISIRTPELTMEDLVNKLEAVVDKVIENTARKMQAVTVPQNTVESLASKLGSAVESLIGVPEKTLEVEQPKVEPTKKKPEQPQKPKITSDMTPIEKFHARYNIPPKQPKTETVEPKTEKTKTRKQPWDIEKQKQFLKDCETMTSEELMAKYELNTKKDVYNNKHRIKARLNK